MRFKKTDIETHTDNGYGAGYPAKRKTWVSIVLGRAKNNNERRKKQRGSLATIPFTLEGKPRK